MEGSRDSRSTKQTKDKEVSKGSKSKSLDIIYTNAQNKIDELRSTVFDLNPDLVLINESWTKKDITRAYLGIDRYNLAGRKDRLDTSNGRGGVIL